MNSKFITTEPTPKRFLINSPAQKRSVCDLQGLSWIGNEETCSNFMKKYIKRTKVERETCWFSGTALNTTKGNFVSSYLHFLCSQVLFQLHLQHEEMKLESSSRINNFFPLLQWLMKRKQQKVSFKILSEIWMTLNS